MLDFLGKIKVGFDFANDLCYDVCHKSCDEDMRPRKDSQRGLCLVQKACNPAVDDTTSELRGRNAPPGAPVNASMSDGCAVTRVEPWNTLYPTPDEFSGDGIIFIPSPNWVMQNSKCKMQNKGVPTARFDFIRGADTAILHCAFCIMHSIQEKGGKQNGKRKPVHL